MKKDNFESMDEKLMKELKGAREHRVPPALLKGFSASVEERIREKESPVSFRPQAQRFVFPVWAPVLAVLVLAFVFATRPIEHVQLAALHVSEISTEVDALRELGIWSDEDEAEFENLEYSQAILSSKNTFA